MKKNIFSVLFLILMSYGQTKITASQENRFFYGPDIIEEKIDFRINLHDFHYEVDTVRSGQVLSQLTEKHGVNPIVLDSLIRITKNVFNLNKIYPGHAFWFLKNKYNQKVEYLIYEINALDYVIFCLKKGQYGALMDRHALLLEKAIFSAKIPKGSSISQVMYQQFPHPNLAIELEAAFEQIYNWTVDFFRIQAEDYFKIIYTQTMVKNKPVGIGRIEACYFNHMGRDYYAFYFPIRHLMGYYDEKGSSLKRFFLAAPIQYKRISSNYSMSRFHPVQKVWKSHLGTDYAAPTGTPIWATADGTVMEATFTKNNGLYVKLYHNKIYQTQYLHMSRIAKGIRPGVRVKQGETIGYVGQTGLASGPHVCYRFWKNGQQVDPKKERFNAQNQVEVSKEPDFLTLSDLFKTQLDQIPNP